MNNLKKFLSAKTIFFYAVIMVGIIVCSACSKDDKSDQPDNPDTPTSTNELVGTWNFTYDGETDYEDYFIFRSNGTGTYHYDDDESDDFTYTYDSKSMVLCLNYKHWDPERFTIEWLGKNTIEFGGYGTYVRK